ncbi:hypothetical protein M2323_002285 [Rhodoblastus acidophilus]|uniref:hypothetical protein n=1 Tax=Rhodoblastus acidophilus TaxID=1074 RepID=UPI001610C63B|nr:hypothetical protein [Rhodoblastus acidophilus]MCW2284507.1 hypothetical protein [Rhodoblastus acidophilus]MCW2333354.1 hypothetical protein [Rhodoblastus acidophilus]
MRLVLCMLGVLALVSPAVAQGEEPAKPPLSERLDQSNGVIKPKQNLDPEIRRPPPPVDAPMPVIPPPGAPGGDPNVKPK